MYIATEEQLPSTSDVHTCMVYSYCKKEVFYLFYKGCCNTLPVHCSVISLCFTF